MQTPAVFSAAIFAASHYATKARSLLQMLASADASSVFRAAGLEPLA
jgi:hypothetical protein